MPAFCLQWAGNTLNGLTQCKAFSNFDDIDDIDDIEKMAINSMKTDKKTSDAAKKPLKTTLSDNDDIRELFDVISSNANHYSEINFYQGAMAIRQRWPLIRELQQQYFYFQADEAAVIGPDDPLIARDIKFK